MSFIFFLVCGVFYHSVLGCLFSGDLTCAINEQDGMSNMLCLLKIVRLQLVHQREREFNMVCCLFHHAAGRGRLF